jgi:hypothetical protein
MKDVEVASYIRSNTILEGSGEGDAGSMALV